MSLNITETEQLLNNIGMSIEDVNDIVKKGVANRFRTMSQLWGYDTVDDLAQITLLYYLSPMKNTGETRLNYYIKKYNDKNHIENQIRFSAYQMPLSQARRKEIKNKPISYDQDVGNDNYLLSIKDSYYDEHATLKIEDNLMLDDLFTELTEELNQINLDCLKKKSKKDSLSFIIDMNNYIKAYNQTKIQLAIVKDLYYGYKRCELNKKYNNYDRQMSIIRNAFLKLYPQYNKSI